MTTRRWHKLAICVGLLAATLCVPHALAGDSESEIACPEGQDPDDQEEPQCCDKDFMEYGDEGYMCVELPSEMSVAVAITLILSFTFLISLQCFMNHHDIDMREYAYTGISLTVSIFSAVLFFQSIAGLVDDLIVERLQEATHWSGKSTHFTVSLVHLLFWYVASQLTIAYVSCALKPDRWRHQQFRHGSSGPRQEVKLDVEIKGVCYGLLLAHVTGFASIRFWTELQQIEPINQSPLLTLVILPASVLAQLCFEKLTDVCREGYIRLRGVKDWFEETWDEKCQHAEDDIMGLTLSVLIVNSLRYAINESHDHKCLPNSEQKEEGTGCEFVHSVSEALWLFGFGLLFVLLLFLTKLAFIKMSAESEVEDGKMKRAVSRLIRGVSGKSMSTTATHDDRTFLESIVTRLEDVALTTLSMAYAWCIFHGTRQLLRVINPSFLGKAEHGTTLAVVLAFGVTYIAWTFIRILDQIADLGEERGWEEVDEAIKTVIRGTSIFVGFAWEQTFDESIGQLSEYTRKWPYFGRHGPPITKLVVGFGCIGVVFFSWKWYILPFVFKKGWRYGYIYSKEDLHERCKELARHDSDFSLSHLQEISHKLSKQNTHMERRFSSDATPGATSARETSATTPADRYTSVGSIVVDGEYRALPDSEFDAMRIEIEDLKSYVRQLENAQQKSVFCTGGDEIEKWKSSAGQLELEVINLKAQLAKEKQAAEECKLQREASGTQLDSAKEEREVRFRAAESVFEFDQERSIKPLTRLATGRAVAENSSGSALSPRSRLQSQLGNDAGSGGPAQDLSDRHLGEASEEQARCGRVGEEGAEGSRRYILAQSDSSSSVGSSTIIFSSSVREEDREEQGQISVPSSDELGSSAMGQFQIPFSASPPPQAKATNHSWMPRSKNSFDKGGIEWCKPPKSASWPHLKTLRDFDRDRRRLSENMLDKDAVDRSESPPKSTSPATRKIYALIDEISKPSEHVMDKGAVGRFKSPSASSLLRKISEEAGEMTRLSEKFFTENMAKKVAVDRIESTLSTSPLPRQGLSFTGKIARPSENVVGKDALDHFKSPQSESPPPKLFTSAEDMQRPPEYLVDNGTVDRFKSSQSASSPPRKKLDFTGSTTRLSEQLAEKSAAYQFQSPVSAPSLPRAKLDLTGKTTRLSELLTGKNAADQFESPFSASPPQKTEDDTGEMPKPFEPIVDNSAVDGFKAPLSASLPPRKLDTTRQRFSLTPPGRGSASQSFSGGRFSLTPPGRERPAVDVKRHVHFSSKDDGSEKASEKFAATSVGRDCRKIHQGLNKIMSALQKVDIKY